MSDHDLNRFVEAQNSVYDLVIRELSLGRKASHWMWFIFPQIAGLGFSAMAQRYAIHSRDEAKAYLAHPLLGPRFEECTGLVMAVPNASITNILGHPDDMKFRSSMTLFYETTGQMFFFDALAKFYPDGSDPRTLSILKAIEMRR